MCPEIAARALRPAANRCGTVGPDDERPVAEVRVERGRQRHRVGDAAADADDPRAVDRDEQLDAECGGRARCRSVSTGAGAPGGVEPTTTTTLGHRAPAERGGP